MPAGIRPSQNIVRKAVFDILGQDLKQMEFLELFAGSGAVGMEAVSLQAQKVIWVEKNLQFARVIEDNLRVLNIRSYGNHEHRFKVIQADSFATVKEMFRQGRKFDIVFADPPYGVGLVKKTLKTLNAYDILHPDCFLIIQHDKRETLPEDFPGRFRLIIRRKYGTSYLTVYTKKTS